MNRRTVLGTLGVAGMLPVLGYTTNRGGSTVSIRFWRTPEAATHDDVDRQLRRLLRQGLDFDHWTLEVSSGGIVDVGTEHAAEAIRGGSWPRTVLGGAAGTQSIEPVWDVNLLVTDGPLTTSPSGYGIPHVAAVGGAGILSETESIATPSDLVPVASGPFAAQLVLHEVGHALGLTHEDGRLYEHRGRSVVTPMLSLYGWRRQDLVRSTCQPPRSTRAIPAKSDRRLDLSYCHCARSALRAYDGDHLG